MKFFYSAALLLIVAPAHANGREFCAERPGQTTPPCTIEPGRWTVETAVADWTHAKDSASIDDDVLVGDTLIRHGIGPATEVQISWTPYGHARKLDRSTGAVDHGSGVGDVTIGFKQAFGAEAPVAALILVTLPTGGSAVGAGTWSASFLVPATFDLSDVFELDLTGEIDASASRSGAGRHLAYGGVAGVGIKVTDTVRLAVDARLLQDRDPEEFTVQATAGTSLAYMVGANTQLDLGAVAGLNAATPDLELYAGISRRF